MRFFHRFSFGLNVLTALAVATVVIGIPAGCSRLAPAPAPTAPDQGPASLAPSPRSDPGPASASEAVTLAPVRDLTQVPTGPWASGVWDDVLLANEHVCLIFGNPSVDPDDPQRAGTLIDLARAETMRDALVGLLPTHGMSLSPSMRFRSLEQETGGYPNGAVAVVVQHESVQLPGLLSKTEYILEPGADFVTLVTTWENQTTGTLQDLQVGDIVHWGTANGFMPGRGSVVSGELVQGTSDYVSGITPHDSFIVAPKDGSVDVQATRNVMCAIYQTVTLTRGESARTERRLFVGDRNLAALSGEAFAYQNLEYGWMSGRLLEVDRTPEGRLMDLGPIEGGEIQVIAGKRNGRLVDALPYSRTFTNSLGEFLIPLPAGTFHARGVKVGHIQPDPTYGIEIVAAATSHVDLTLGPACRVAFRVVDSATSQPIPCKITFESMINTKPLDLGPPDSVAGLNAYYSATGQGVLPVEPGNYRVHVTRGPEYTAEEKLMRLQPGRMHSLEVSLRRVVPTDGWISVDAGVETDATRGCLVTAADRVTAAAGEGVEFLVSGDELVATDLSEAAGQLGLSPYLKTAVGMKIPATWKDPLGTFMVFPVEPGTPAPGLEPTTSPEAFFSRLRGVFPGALLTVRRAVFPLIGYYNLFGYDPETRTLPESSRLSRDFDLLEIWEDKRAGAFIETLPLYRKEILSGYRFGPIGGSQSTAMQTEEVGYPRTYVAVANDNPGRVSKQEIYDSLRAGRVVVTNGPFIDFKVQGQGPGSLVKSVDGVVEIEMKVYAANWVNTYTYEVDQNGMFLRSSINPQGTLTAPLRFPQENQNKTMRIRCTKDCTLSGVVYGGLSLAPIVSPVAPTEEGQVYPYAVTGPVFVDADGDGKCTPAIPDYYKGVVPEEEIEE